MPVGDIVGFAVIAGSRIILPAEIATIDATAQIPAIATIGTIQFANISIGTVEVGTVTAVIDLGTIGTIISGYVNVGFVGTIGTLQAGYVSSDQISKLTNVATNAVITSATIATIVASNLQDLVVDVVYGTVVTGSIITAVIGVEPQTGIKTSTITAGSWFAGTVVTGQRIVAPGPLGYEVAVTAYVATAGTINAGTATGVYITAEQSATG